MTLPPSDRCQQLQQQVEAKGAECARLRKAADQVKTMQLTIDSLKAELGSMQVGGVSCMYMTL